MRVRIALILLLAIQVGILALIRFRADLDTPTFLLTYWLPITVSLAVVIYLWPSINDD